MARCAICRETLPSTCDCSVVDTDCIEWAGAGSSISPWVPSFVIDPDTDNLIVCGLDGLRADFPDYITNPMRVKVWKEDNQVIEPGEEALVSDVIGYDTGTPSLFRTTTTRLAAPVTGLYEFGCSAAFNYVNAVIDTYLDCRLNGSTLLARRRIRQDANDTPTVVQCSTEHRLTAGQYIEFYAGHTHGGNVALISIPRLSPCFWMSLVAEG